MNFGGPSRSIPLSTRALALFAGPFNQLGWIMFGFGMVFFWLFVCRADLTSWYRFRGPLQTVQGRVTGSSKTSASEGGSRSRRGTPIYRNDFTYSVAGKAYLGISYATGLRLNAGRSVTVEYLLDNPQTSRIRGMRTNVFSGIVLFVIIFPLIGFAMVLSTLRRGLKACLFLTNGVLTDAKLISKSATNVRVNNRMVYKLAFVFTTLHGESCTAETKTAGALFENDASEPALYLPAEPRKAVLLNDLPGAPKIDKKERVYSENPMAAVGCLVIPVITLIGHTYWAIALLVH